MDKVTEIYARKVGIDSNLDQLFAFKQLLVDDIVNDLFELYSLSRSAAVKSEYQDGFVNASLYAYLRIQLKYEDGIDMNDEMVKT